MIQNPHHLSEGRRMRVVSIDGTAQRATLLHNDRRDRVLRFEAGEGDFFSLSYDDFASASRNLRH